MLANTPNTPARYFNASGLANNSTGERAKYFSASGGRPSTAPTTGLAQSIMKGEPNPNDVCTCQEQGYKKHLPLVAAAAVGLAIGYFIAKP
jgi:hypothetical protein